MKDSLRKIYGERTPIVIVSTLLCVLQSFALFQSDTTIGSGTIVLFAFLLQIVLSIYLVLSFNKEFHFDNSTTLLLLSVFSWWLLESVIHNYKGIAIFSFIAPLILSIYIILSDYSKALAYKAFHTVFFWVCLLGIIAYLLYVFNIIPPLSMVDFYEEDTTAQYANYGFAYVLDTNATIGFKRLCGLYNEPGLLGTFGAFVLIIEELRINFKNIIIFVACIMCFSMAFYLILFIYLALKVILSRDRKSIIVILCLFAALFYLSTQNIVNDDLARFVERFVFDEGRLSGDDRTGSADAMVWKRVLSNPSMLWFGYGQEYDFFGSSYQSIIIKHGIIGFTAMFLPLFLGAFKIARRNKICMVFLMCFMVSIYQRTQIFNVAYFSLLLGGMQYIKMKDTLLKAGHVNSVGMKR